MVQLMLKLQLGNEIPYLVPQALHSDGRKLLIVEDFNFSHGRCSQLSCLLCQAVSLGEW